MGELLNKRMKGKQNTNGLNKNKQNINKKGQPKKGISFVNDELEAKGCSPAKKADIEANYMSLLQLDESELIELGQDKKKPMLVRILAKNMLGGRGFDIVEKMLDRGIGKPTQSLDTKNDNTNLNVGADIESIGDLSSAKIESMRKEFIK